MNHTPLYTVQHELGANFRDFGGWEKSGDYGDVMAEYRAVREHIGLLDRSERGKLVLTGSDRLSWLQGMISNDVRPLGSGEAQICGCVLNATGHLLADVRVINRTDSLLLDMTRDNAEKIYRLLDGFIITEDVEIVEQSDFLACLSVQGTDVKEAWVQEQVTRHDGALVAAADHTGIGGYDIYLKATEAPTLWHALIAAGARPVGEQAVEILRIEAGIPLYGVDMDESTIPLECNLEATHISHTKGCYVGQEIIARVHSRGHTNRALTGLVVQGSALPYKGDKLFPTLSAEGEAREVGWVTSAAHSPRLGKVIALGYVRHEYREPDTNLRIIRDSRGTGDDDEALSATVTTLPFP